MFLTILPYKIKIANAVMASPTTLDYRLTGVGNRFALLYVIIILS